MKKSLLSIALALGMAATSSASLLVYEGFNYSTGSTLNGQAGGTGLIGGWADGMAGGHLPVVDGLSYGDLVVSGNGAADNSSSTHSNYRIIGDAANYTQAGQKQWFSYLLNVPTGVTSGQFYVTFFGSSSYQGFGARTNFMDGNLVLHTNRDGLTSGQASLTHGETHMILGSINWLTDTTASLSIWIDPDLATLTDESHLGTAQLSTAGALSAVGDWLWVRGNGPVQAFVDEIRLGTTLADVTPVPEPSTYAALFGAVALGVVIVRRRSKAASEG